MAKMKTIRDVLPETAAVECEVRGREWQPALSKAGPVNVLLVDDRPDKLLVLDTILADLGQNLVKAVSGKDALRCLLQQDFAVVLLDVNMPGMDGFETAAMIRQRKQCEHTPIIFLTAYSENETHRTRGYSLGAVDYIHTPIVPEVLRAKVAVFVDLFKKTAALRHIQGELEERVRIRTAELAKANEALQLEVVERKKAEEAVAQRARELTRINEELEQFAYVASHDMQEPLRMVTNYMQLLEKKYKDSIDPQGGKYIAYAVDGAKRMQAMIKDLLSYSRVGNSKDPMQPTDTAKALDSALFNLKHAIEEARAKIDCGKLPVIMANAFQLVQVFQNLISNAIKFRKTVAPRIRISADRDGPYWLFSVQDNGIGIEPQYHQRIFNIFQRLHEREDYPGSGIGLTITRKIIERHGGGIWVDSRLGEGTTVYFTLPFHE